MRRVVVLLSLLALAADGLGAATHTVDVGPGMVFTPTNLSVEEGDTVTWNFLEPTHTTTSDATTGPEVWNSGIVPAGGTFSHVFSTVGSHPYHCATHSFPGGFFMNGVITVTAPPPPPPPPMLTTVSPTSGPTAGGTLVTLGGNNFVGDCTASFDGIAAATTFVDFETLDATTPPHAAGAVDVGVSCSTGSSTLPGAFTYADTLAVTAVIPPSAAPGAEVVIQGSNFDPAITVQFDAVAAAVTFVDSTTIRVIVPALAPGPVTISASNPAGAPATAAFTVLAQTAGIPLLSGFGLLLLAAFLGVVGWVATR